MLHVHKGGADLTQWIVVTWLIILAHGFNDRRAGVLLKSQSHRPMRSRPRGQLVGLTHTFHVRIVYVLQQQQHTRETLARDWRDNITFHAKGHFTHKPSAMTIPQKNKKVSIQRPPKSSCTVPYGTLKCSVKSYVTGPSTKCYFNGFLSTRDKT